MGRVVYFDSSDEDGDEEEDGDEDEEEECTMEEMMDGLEEMRQNGVGLGGRSSVKMQNKHGIQ